MTDPRVATTASKWRRMHAGERVAFAQAVFLVPTLHIALWLLGFARVRQWADAAAPSRRLRNGPIAERVRVGVVSVNRVKQMSWFHGNCLSQSMALTWMLRRRGVEPVLHLGVRATKPRFDAHAWVELNGQVLNDTDDVRTRFAPLVKGA